MTTLVVILVFKAFVMQEC